MRRILTKYAGSCVTCGAAIPLGAEAMYERRMGVFCVPCAPTDPEAIRAVRQEAADRKADRLDGWAEKREEKASKVLDVDRNHYSRDWAFITQPGHIPARARWIAKQEREFENVREAARMRAKANSLRNGVRVAGDAQAKHDAEDVAVRAWIAVGQRVETWHFGCGVVEKINRKTASVRLDVGGVSKVALRFIRRRLDDGPRCGCPLNAPEANPAEHRCPCGSHCVAPECVPAARSV